MVQMMIKYKVIDPLGGREGPGTFDTIFDEKYFRMQKAIKKNDFVVMNFVMDNCESFYIESYHSQTPDNKIRHKLIKQNFLLGLSEKDFKICYDLAQSLLK